VAEIVSEEQRTPVEEPGSLGRPKSDVIVQQRRFGVAYFLLAIGVGVAVGLAIVLIGRDNGHHATTTTQAFKPTAGGELGAKEIARHVAHKYRLANGQQLVGVIGERPNYQNLSMFFYLIRPHDAQYPNDIKSFEVKNGIMYSMCAFATTSCSVAQDSATTQLLKRESLELAFTTFKTDSSVDTVTTLLPPASQTGIAIILSRNQLSSVLGQPMSKLLPGSGPIKAGSIKSAESEQIDLLVDQGLYSYDAQQGPDGNPILRLDPLR